VVVFIRTRFNHLLFNGRNVMAVPASKVKTVCTKAEADLVRASRKPQVEQLTAAQVNKYAAQARKLLEKWQGQKRSQARARSKQEGMGSADANSKLKVQIFREALANFKTKLKKLESAGTKAKKTAEPSKATRAASHRAGRAAVREELKQTKLAMRAAAPTKKKAAGQVQSAPKAGTSAAKPVAVAEPSSAPMPETGAPAATPPPAQPTKARPPKKKAGLQVTKAKQLKALTAAKQARFVQSGQTTRMKGHVSARGRRAQGRRDSMNG
jgi:hypothetical protein